MCVQILDRTHWKIHKGGFSIDTIVRNIHIIVLLRVFSSSMPDIAQIGGQLIKI